MGYTELLETNLSDYVVSKDPNQFLQWQSIGVFDNSYGIGVHWNKDLKLTGSYRIEVELSATDVLKLFKATFGSVLHTGLTEHLGFTVSEDLKKAILKNVKLADLTLGELAALTGPPAEKKPEVQPPAQSPRPPFLRRV